jgi:diguanylate cyclase (GGDEF)-like protein
LAGHGWVATLEDISVRHAAEQKIAYLAHHDLLTGLANRTLLREQLRLACAATLPSRCFSVVYLDLDKFKDVNDTFGHPVGDGLLVAVADRLRATVGAGDSVFRLGGDEFVILHFSLTDQAETISLSRRIVEAIGRPFVIDGNVLSIGVSIGIALATNDRMNPERLLQDADQALYRSKREGRGTWSVFEPTITVSANARSKADDGLLHSLSQGRVSAAGDRGYLVKETGSPRNRRS